MMIVTSAITFAKMGRSIKNREIMASLSFDLEIEESLCQAFGLLPAQG